MSCNYCGDEHFDADLDSLDNGDAICMAPGCGVVFTQEDVDPDELRFGFHIVTPSVMDDADDSSLDDFLVNHNWNDYWGAEVQESEAERQANRLAGRDEL